MFLPGHSFGLLALEGLPLDQGVPGDLHLDGARRAVRGFPLELEGETREQLGRLLCDRLERTTLTFVVQEPRFGDGREESMREAEALFRALQLVGFVRLEAHPIWVAGRTEAAGPAPVESGELRRPRIAPGCTTPPLGWVELGHALRIREGLARLQDQGPANLLHRALATFTSGTHRNRAEERVHEFVRAMEALAAPGDGQKYRRTFRSRTRLFFGKEADRLLRRLYRVKRRAGHARDVLDLYEGLGDGFSRRVALWHDAVTAEVLARTLLKRVLLSPDLWEHLCFEAGIERFFSKAFDQVERTRIWGRAIDVDAARGAFRRGVVQPVDSEL